MEAHSEQLSYKLSLAENAGENSCSFKHICISGAWLCSWHSWSRFSQSYGHGTKCSHDVPIWSIPSKGSSYTTLSKHSMTSCYQCNKPKDCDGNVRPDYPLARCEYSHDLLESSVFSFQMCFTLNWWSHRRWLTKRVPNRYSTRLWIRVAHSLRQREQPAASLCTKLVAIDTNCLSVFLACTDPICLGTKDCKDSASLYYTLKFQKIICLQVAERLEAAVTSALEAGYRTGDLYSAGMKKVGCKEMGRILADYAENPENTTGTMKKSILWCTELLHKLSTLYGTFVADTVQDLVWHATVPLTDVRGRRLDCLFHSLKWTSLKRLPSWNAIARAVSRLLAERYYGPRTIRHKCNWTADWVLSL